MVRIIGIRFNNTGKVYYFSPGEMDIKAGQKVLVETARGVECADVIIGIRDVDESKIVAPLKDVIRIATDEDMEIHAQNKIKEKEAFKICNECIKKHKLDMKLIDVEYTFDNNKIMFFFIADARIDFRDLVKELASIFKTRIELRQVGVRDQAKTVGGLGVCGRPICCASSMPDFQPVSIKMAKEQNLSLNPTKISGTCGRLMCCLKYEQEAYEDALSRLPGIGSVVDTPEGRGVVEDVNLLRETLKVKLSTETESELLVFKAEDVTIVKKKHTHHNNNDKFDNVEELMETQRGGSDE